MRKQIAAAVVVLVAVLLTGCSVAGGSADESPTQNPGSSAPDSTYTIESFQDGRYEGTDPEGYSWTITPQAGNIFGVTVTRDGLPPKLSSGTMKVVGSDLVFTMAFSGDDQLVDYVITATDAAPGEPLSATVAKNGADAGAMTLTPTAS
ncbi:hypothetical protein [Glaciibacter superstes]|uniref:hypothetical protein n=1 Tax=Glaciibacter superstes TaxID=501023 RepID=UPI0003B36216|nr:hypothetical protein [Glaciibacter superstes]